MIRRFCDACGDQIDTNYVTERLKGDRTFRPTRRDVGTMLADPIKVSVEIIAGTNGVTNAGDLCADCIIDTVMGLDTRPQAVLTVATPNAIAAAARAIKAEMALERTKGLPASADAYAQVALAAADSRATPIRVEQ